MENFETVESLRMTPSELFTLLETAQPGIFTGYTIAELKAISLDPFNPEFVVFKFKH